MAGENRTETDALTLFRELEENPYRYGLFSILRRIEGAFQDRAGFGRSLRPADDPVRLGQSPSMAFAPAELAGYTPGKEGRPGRLEALGFGMFGPNGPLPLHLTEFARDRLHNSHDATFTRFVDLFHHRMISLFYRAWADTDPAVCAGNNDEDDFALYVGALIGLGGDAVRGRDAVADSAKLYYAGRLSSQSRSAEGLQDMLADFFRMSIEILEFQGEWLPLQREDRWRLGETPLTGTMGLNATIGESVWGCQHHFRIRVGPLDYADFQRLLPGTPHLARMVAMVRGYVGDEMTWDANLVLKEDEVPPLELGKSGLLGLTTWLNSDQTSGDRYDAILHPSAAERAQAQCPAH